MSPTDTILFFTIIINVSYVFFYYFIKCTENVNTNVLFYIVLIHMLLNFITSFYFLRSFENNKSPIINFYTLGLNANKFYSVILVIIYFLILLSFCIFVFCFLFIFKHLLSFIIIFILITEITNRFFFNDSDTEYFVNIKSESFTKINKITHFQNLYCPVEIISNIIALTLTDYANFVTTICNLHLVSKSWNQTINSLNIQSPYGTIETKHFNLLSHIVSLMKCNYYNHRGLFIKSSFHLKKLNGLINEGSLIEFENSGQLDLMVINKHNKDINGEVLCTEIDFGFDSFQCDYCNVYKICTNEFFFIIYRYCLSNKISPEFITHQFV